MQSNRMKQLLAIISLGFCFGSMFNITYLKYVLYDGMMEAMSVTHTQLSLMTTVYGIVILLIIIPSGIIADKYKPKKIIIWSSIANGLCCVAYGFVLDNYALCLLIWGLQGVTNGGCFFVCSLKAIRIVSPADGQSKAYGIFEAFSGVSSLLSNFVALALFAKYADSYGGIQAAAVSMGLWCFVGAALVAVAYKEKAIIDDEAEQANSAGFDMKACFNMLKHPGTYLITVYIFCCYSFYVSQSYLTPYFTSVLGSAAVFSGGLAILRSYGLRLISGPLGGAIAQKMGSPSKLGIVGNFVLILLIISVRAIPAGYSGAVALSSTIVLVLAAVALMLKGTMWATMEEAGIPPQYSGMAISFATMFGINATDIFLPIVYGNWLDKYDIGGYSYIFTTFILLCVVGAAAASIIIIRNKKIAQKAVLAQ